MFKQVRAAVVCAMLTGTGMAGAVSADAHASGGGHAPASVAKAAIRPGATLVASRSQVSEGDNYVLTARVRAARRASTITLSKYQEPAYSFQDPQWTSVSTRSVNSQSTVRFPVVATSSNTERYRVSVAYKKVGTVTSSPTSVSVWRWIPLNEYDPYYLSEPFGMSFGTVTINGRAYAGWGPTSYSHTGTWEARFTPGRRCVAFRGVLGVGDISDDGSSATVGITADDTVVHTSQPLTPGMSVPVTIPLTSMPYRLGIQINDTTPGGTTKHDEVESWPVIGEPALLCNGV